MSDGDGPSLYGLSAKDLQRITIGIIEGSQSGSIPPDVFTTPYKSVQTAIEITDYIESIKNILDKEYKDKGRHINFDFGVDYPDIQQPPEQPIITWSLDFRTNGLFEQARDNRNGLKNPQYQFRETVEDPDNPGYSVIVLEKWMDNEVCFRTWSRTSQQAIEMALELESILERYNWYISARGTSKSKLKGWGKPEVTKAHNIKVVGIPITYYVRTSKILAISTKNLERIHINVGASS